MYWIGRAATIGNNMTSRNFVCYGDTCGDQLFLLNLIQNLLLYVSGFVCYELCVCVYVCVLLADINLLYDNIIFLLCIRKQAFAINVLMFVF